MREDAAHAVLPHERDDMGVGYEVSGRPNFGARFAQKLQKQRRLDANPHVRQLPKAMDITQSLLKR